jgi:light-regulated signal transduction histidine kinase (bacteriophytochrome)
MAFEPVDCAAVVSSVLAALRSTIEESHTSVTCDPLPVVTADKTQLVQVFQNLVANAVKFHDSSHPHVHVSATKDAGDWTFSVRDDGIGIAPEFLERVFVIFQRLHSRDKYPGTGIGLAICKRIVERHGGRIWAESRPGEGSTFFFTIPDTMR